MTEQKIKIMAEPQAEPNQCKFLFETPLYPGGSFRFGKDDDYAGSAMAEHIFKVKEVVEVFISAISVVVTTDGVPNWREIGKELGTRMREAINSGQDLIKKELFSELPTESEVREQVLEVIESEINPAVAQHGGFIDLVEVKHNDIVISMGGGCQGCGSAAATLKQGVEQSLRRSIPHLGMIFDSTDHAAGTNPYFK